MVVMYLVDALAAIVDGLNAIRPLSLFRYYMGDDPLRNGHEPRDVAVLVGGRGGAPGRRAGRVRAARPRGVAGRGRRRTAQ